MQNKYIKIGYIGKPNGLRGAFFVAGRSEPIPPELKQIYLRSPEETVVVGKIKSKRMSAGRPVLTLEEFCDREALRLAMGWEILIQRNELQLAADEYCWADVIGKIVIDQTGEELGVVTEIDNYGATDVITVKHDARGELSIPFVRTIVDMSFKPADLSIRLQVPAETFTEAWQN